MKIASKRNLGFTIVELLVVIVVIAILAAFTFLAYRGISANAIASSLQSDLSSGAKKLKLYAVDHGTYPQSLDSDNCPVGPADDQHCLIITPGNTFTYTSSSPYNTFTLDAKNTATNTTYRITNDNNVAVLVPPLPADEVQIGAQVWKKYNLNIGTRVDAATGQTNNAVVEKFCYNDLESNCDTYGGLYQWSEAMQYVTTSGAQGICPTGFHIPTDAEYITLEIALGMAPATAATSGYRQTTAEGTKLKTGGSSGWEGLLGGLYSVSGGFSQIGTSAGFLTSTENGFSYNYNRSLMSSNVGVGRNILQWKTNGNNLRCLKN